MPWSRRRTQLSATAKLTAAVVRIYTTVVVSKEPQATSTQPISCTWRKLLHGHPLPRRSNQPRQTTATCAACTRCSWRTPTGRREPKMTRRNTCGSQARGRRRTKLRPSAAKRQTAKKAIMYTLHHTHAARFPSEAVYKYRSPVFDECQPPALSAAATKLRRAVPDIA